MEPVTVAQASGWVMRNEKLWDKIPDHYQESLRNNAPKFKNLDWVNTEWAIESIKTKNPALASLFLGWRKGHNWLGRQVEIIKEEVQK